MPSLRESIAAEESDGSGTHSIVEHGGENSALHRARRVEEIWLGLEAHANFAAPGIDRQERPAQELRHRRHRRTTFNHIPERPAARHFARAYLRR
jgi:hypothetical protein